MIRIYPITPQHHQYPALIALRDEVLRRPLGLSIHNDDLRPDETAIILVAAQEDDQLAGCVLLQPQPDKKVLRLRAMAVIESLRGTGTGRALVKAAEAAALQAGAEKIILHARQVVLPFYEKLGYTATGASFSEVGIPHLMMYKMLPS